MNHAKQLSAALVAAAILVLASCSLPVDGEVQALDDDEFSDIVYGVSTTSTTTPPEEESTRLLLFYVVGEDGLGTVVRPLADPTIGEVLTALQAAPTEEEIDEYATQFEGPLRTALPVGLNPTARALESDSSLLAIEVDDEGGLRDMPNERPAQAEFVFSQIVCTLTNLDLKSGDVITKVEFYDSGGRIPIVDSNRSLIPGEQAGASDFRDCETVEDRREAAEAEAETEGSTTTTS